MEAICIHKALPGAHMSQGLTLCLCYAYAMLCYAYAMLMLAWTQFWHILFTDTQNHTQNIQEVLHSSRCSRASRSYAKTGSYF